jgi:hypothetical protein
MTRDCIWTEKWAAMVILIMTSMNMWITRSIRAPAWYHARTTVKKSSEIWWKDSFQTIKICTSSKKPAAMIHSSSWQIWACET